MNRVEKTPQSSHAYKKGDIVVFNNITWNEGEHSGFYADHLHEVIKVHRGNNYLEIKETKCRHSNRRSWGSNGTDIRKAEPEEILARSRLPKTISYTAHNPEGKVVFLNGRNDVLSIKHYIKDNSLLLVDKNGLEIVVEIFDIREATVDEMSLGYRQELIKDKN